MNAHISKALEMTIPEKRSTLIDQEAEQLTEIEVLEGVPESQDLCEVRKGNAELERISRQASAAGIDLLDEAGNMDPRYKARLLEVAGSLLSTAASAIKQRQDSSIKLIERQDKLNAGGPGGGGGGVTNNNLIVADRNELIKLIKATKQEGKQ